MTTPATAPAAPRTAPNGARRPTNRERQAATDKARRQALADAGIALPPDPPRNRTQTAPHGTRQRYVQGCRCDPCRQANTAYTRTQRGGLKLPRPLPEHGTTARYRKGCKCPECRAANAAASRRLYHQQREHPTAPRRGGARSDR